jgi:adenylyl- and sulfurtransferase ThiI
VRTKTRLYLLDLNLPSTINKTARRVFKKLAQQVLKMTFGFPAIMAVIVRYAEIGIKGKNRARFEQALVQNIQACLQSEKIQFTQIKRLFGRILIETDNECKCLKRVFGTASFSSAITTGRTIEEAFAAAKKAVKLTEKDSFRITCQRTDKKFPLTSQEVCVQLGEKIASLTSAKVKMKNPAKEIIIEIIDGAIYLMTSRTEGPGGLPVSTQGKIIALIEDENSVLASLFALKRGCTIIPALMKEIDISLLQKLSCPHAQKPIRITSLNDLPGLGVPAIVVNDVLDSIRPIQLNALILRPLCGLNREELNNARKHFENLLAAN